MLLIQISNTSSLTRRVRNKKRRLSSGRFPAPVLYLENTEYRTGRWKQQKTFHGQCPNSQTFFFKEENMKHLLDLGVIVVLVLVVVAIVSGPSEKEDVDLRIEQPNTGNPLVDLTIIYYIGAVLFVLCWVIPLGLLFKHASILV